MVALLTSLACAQQTQSLVDTPTPAITATSVPAATATPEPTATPGPTVALPDDVGDLITQANDTFERAQALLQQGDFAGYGEEIERLEEILQRLGELTQ